MIVASASPVTDIVLAVIIVVLLFGSGALAMAETSLVRTTRVKARSLEDEKRRGSKALVSLVEKPEKFLNPVLLLVLVCQLVSATLIGILADQWLGAWGVLAATVFEVVVIFVFFEAVPKNWAVHHPEQAALASAPVVAWLIKFPPVKALASVLIGLSDLVLGRRGETSHATLITESELLAMADVARDESVIDPEEREFIHSVIEFGDTVVREVMVPRPDMVALETTASVSEALVEALEAGFSRLPVYLESIDDVTGIAYTKDLMRLEREGRGDEPVADHSRVATFVPETKQVSGLLRQMQDLKVHQVIVVDEYGGTAGLATLEDVIEELVGEIVDEFDVEEPPNAKLDERTYEVSGRMPIDELDELVDAQLPKGSWDTVGGLLLDLIGGVPEVGESEEVDGFRLTAVSLDGRRIERVRIDRLGPTEADVDETAGTTRKETN
jgi:CBS domain containing-hemolysin-like protein